MPGGVMTSGATPWWTNDQAGGRNGSGTYNKLTTSTPAGYEYDPVQGQYVPTVGSADHALANETRTHGIQDKLLGMLDGLNTTATNAVQSGDGYGAGASGAPHVGMAPGAVGPIPDASGAQNAAFGAAKAKAGAMGRASVQSLSGELADRGVVGGGTEARGITDRLAAATNPLSDLNVAQQQENLGIVQHNQDMSNENAKAEYSGNIAQRGQDISAQDAAANRDLAARSQKLQMLSQVLTGLMPRVNVGMSF